MSPEFQKVFEVTIYNYMVHQVSPQLQEIPEEVFILISALSASI